MAEMFKVFGEGVDITKADPGLRLFFTNYSLGYRAGSETGGITKRVMRQDAELFDDLVLAVKPKIIICLGRITYEMVAKVTADGFQRSCGRAYHSGLHFQRIRLFPFTALLIAVQEGFPTSAERTICEKRGKRLQKSIKTCAKEGF
ncbi:MAG: hypothetical protein IJM42_00890 [Synergistes sp.]|nr:hypothetical protein [Synergistes sp.]